MPTFLSTDLALDMSSVLQTPRQCPLPGDPAKRTKKTHQSALAHAVTREVLPWAPWGRHEGDHAPGTQAPLHKAPRSHCGAHSAVMEGA